MDVRWPSSCAVTAGCCAEAPDGMPHRRGAILVAVMLITIILAGMVLVLCRVVRVEAMASANQVAAAQASSIERAAEQYVLALVAQQRETIFDLSETYFAAVPMDEGYFWVIRPDYGDPNLPLFGLVDEASKVNLNSATADMLIALPGIPPELTFSIVDWRDGDSDVSDDGAENEYYMSLPEPYYCKNSNFETVEEVLLVRGAYPELIYGYAPDQAVQTGGVNRAMSLTSSAITDQQLARGLFDLLTVYSREPQATGAGEKINVRDRQSRTPLRTMLREAFGNTRGDEIADAARPERGIEDIFEYYRRSGMTAAEFDQVAAQLGTWDPDDDDPPAPAGLINVNTAPREVLLCLPNMDEATVDKIIAARSGLGANRRGIAWLADALGEDATGLGNRITYQSYQFSADILAVSNNGRAFKRVRVVVDAAGAVPKVIYRRDVTERGWPLPPETLVALRTGAFTPLNQQPMSFGAATR